MAAVRSCRHCGHKTRWLIEGLCDACAAYILAVTHDQALRHALWRAIGWPRDKLPPHRCPPKCPGGSGGLFGA